MASLGTIPPRPTTEKRKRKLTRKEHGLMISGMEHYLAFVKENGWGGLPDREFRRLNELTEGTSIDSLTNLVKHLKDSWPYA